MQQSWKYRFQPFFPYFPRHVTEYIISAPAKHFIKLEKMLLCSLNIKRARYHMTCAMICGSGHVVENKVVMAENEMSAIDCTKHLYSG